MVSSEEIERFFDLCYEGDLEEVAQLLRQDPTLIKCKHEESGDDQFKIKNRNMKMCLKYNRYIGAGAGKMLLVSNLAWMI